MGVQNILGCQISCDTGMNICQVAELLDYLAVKESASGPLFTFSDGRMLTRQLKQESTSQAIVTTASALGPPLPWQQRGSRTALSKHLGGGSV